MPIESNILVAEYHEISSNRKFNNKDKSIGKLRYRFKSKSKTRRDLEYYLYSKKGHMKREYT